MSNLAVKLTPGDGLRFAYRFLSRWPTGIPLDYATAKFEVRSGADLTLTPWISITETTGITFVRETSRVLIEVPATLTIAVPPINARLPHLVAHAQLRIFHATDPAFTFSKVIPRFLIMPNGVAAV